MLAHDALHPRGLGVLVRGIVEMQHDARAARRRVLDRQWRDRKSALSVRCPAPGLGGARASQIDGHFVGDHEGRIEANAELADQGRRLPSFLVGALRGELLEKSPRAGTCNRAERLDQLLPTHAHTVVGEGQRLLVGIDGQGDREGVPVFDQFGFGERLVTQFFTSVSGVRNQLAHKDVAVRVDGMDHEVQQPRDVGFKTLCLGGGGVGQGGVVRLRMDVGRQSSLFAS